MPCSPKLLNLVGLWRSAVLPLYNLVDGGEDVEDLAPPLACPQVSAKVIDKDKCRGGDEVVNSNTAQDRKASGWVGVGGEMEMELR